MLNYKLGVFCENYLQKLEVAGSKDILIFEYSAYLEVLSQA